MASAVPVTDHETIRRWAEQRGGKPSRVRGTGGKGDARMIRVDFPGFSGAGKLEEISWDEWYPDLPPGKDKSNFNKIISREHKRAANE